MLSKRIIPCLDVKDGRVVKGVNFVNLRDAGDPVEIAKKYSDEGADEICFLDITASNEERKTMIDVVERTAGQVFVPLTVGGGVRTLDDVRQILLAGADKVSINTAAVKNPDFVKEAADKFGSQCIVVAIDARSVGDSKWEVFTHGGRNPTGIDAVEWAQKMEDYMDKDGTKSGYDLPLTKTISRNLRIPIIASGGAGNLEHLSDGVKLGEADAVLVASIFHYGEYTIKEAKEFLSADGISVRL